jgi:hypothetical protein
VPEEAIADVVVSPVEADADAARPEDGEALAIAADAADSRGAVAVGDSVIVVDAAAFQGAAAVEASAVAVAVRKAG